MENNMTDKEVYLMAEWFAQNAEYIRLHLTTTYIKARQLPREQAKELVEDKLLYIFCEHHDKWPVFEIEEAFKDDRVATVVARTFNKEFIYEH
jgi:hypothetical protein